MSSELSTTATAGSTAGVSAAALLERDRFAGLPAAGSEGASAILGGQGAGATGAGAVGGGVIVAGMTFKEAVGGHTGTVVIAGAAGEEIWRASGNGLDTEEGIRATNSLISNSTTYTHILTHYDTNYRFRFRSLLDLISRHV